MDYTYLDKEEYKKYPIVDIKDNNNNLPFFIVKRTQLNQVKHRHAFVQIIYVSKGKCKHVLNDNEFEIFKGDIFIMPPYVPHYFIQEDDVEIYEYEFVPEFLNEKFSQTFYETSFTDFAYLEPFLVIENKIKPRLNLYGAAQREVEDTLREILLEYEDQNEDFELIFGINSFKSILERLAPLKINNLIYTKNEKGIDYMFDQNEFHLSVNKLNPVSAVGAGDSFNAGIIYYLFKNNISKGIRLDYQPFWHHKFDSHLNNNAA